MKFVLSIAVFVFFGCFLFVTGQRVSLTSVGDGTPLGGGEWDFTEANTATDCEQACPVWYARINGKLRGFFKFAIFQVIELNSTGGGCCTNCPTTLNTCNRRAIYSLQNFFNTTIITPSKQVVYSGNIGSIPTATQQCTAVSDPICPLLQVNYQVFDTAGTVNILDQSFQVRKDSVFGKFKVTNWSYFANSKGLRVALLLTVGDTNTNKLVINPGELSNPGPTTGFQTATIVDSQGRQAAIAFVNYASYDGLSLAQNVTVSGPYSDPNDSGGSLFYVDLPKTASNGMEIYFNLYLPSLTGGNDVVASTKFLAPLGAVFLAIMCIASF